jgi:hypothetical protein
MWWCKPVIPALGKMRKEDKKFASLGDVARQCLKKKKNVLCLLGPHLKGAADESHLGLWYYNSSCCQNAICPYSPISHQHLSVNWSVALTPGGQLI